MENRWASSPGPFWPQGPGISHCSEVTGLVLEHLCGEGRRRGEPDAATPRSGAPKAGQAAGAAAEGVCVQVKARDQLPSNAGATAHTNSEAHARGTWCLAGLRAQARGDRQTAATWGPLSQPLPSTLGKMVEGQKDLLGGHNKA